MWGLATVIIRAEESPRPFYYDRTPKWLEGGGVELYLWRAMNIAPMKGPYLLGDRLRPWVLLWWTSIRNLLRERHRACETRDVVRVETWFGR